jgi:large subunit ribosomal protein L5
MVSGQFSGPATDCGPQVEFNVPAGTEKARSASGACGKHFRNGTRAALKTAHSGRRKKESKAMAARLKEKYHKEIKQALQKELGLDNPMAVPELDKIVVNMGLGEATGNTKLLDPLVANLAEITGQKPVTTKAKKSIAAFKVRAGMSIGAMVTLRNEKAYEFLDRLISTALPRVRDFRGVSTKSFDGRGNYTLGLRDQLIFPEIDYSKVEKMKGMNITIVTTAKDDNQARALLKAFGMPFRQGA